MVVGVELLGEPLLMKTDVFSSPRGSKLAVVGSSVESNLLLGA